MPVTRTGPGVATVETALAGLADQEARVGWFESSIYEDGTPVAYVATIHEFGTGRIPARPFMRPAVAQYGQKWLNELAEGAKMCLTTGASPVAVLDAVALGAAGNVGEVIQSITSPPLAASTIKRKGFDKPLVDTKKMFTELAHRVGKV